MGHDASGAIILTLPVTELFGPTLQGEGPYAGRLASFIRLGGCNLACSWCDSAFTWDATRYDLRVEIAARTVDEILAELDPLPPTVVITGGEPLLYADSQPFSDLLNGLRSGGASIHVESNGTRFPSAEVLALIDVVVLSPKLANAGPHKPSQDPRLDPHWLTYANHAEVYLKYVCESRADVELAVARSTAAGWPLHRVWVMPQAAGVDELAARWPEIASAAATAGVNATSRLHLLAWGNARGH